MSEDTKNIKYCSFCGKSQHEAGKLIAGPNVFICDACINLCSNIIKEENKKSLAEGAKDTPTPQEMRAQIDAARIVTKEMKAQMRKDARMAKRVAANQAAQAAEAPVEEATEEKNEDAE